MKKNPSSNPSAGLIERKDSLTSKATTPVTLVCYLDGDAQVVSFGCVGEADKLWVRLERDWTAEHAVIGYFQSDVDGKLGMVHGWCVEQQILKDRMTSNTIVIVCVRACVCTHLCVCVCVCLCVCV